MTVTRLDTLRHDPAARPALVHLQAISLQEAAKRLDLDVRSLYRMEKRGELRLLRYCSRTRVPLSELERLLTPAPQHSASTYTEAVAADQHMDTTT